MFKNSNARKTKDGTPIWYVFIDESGHPYYDSKDSGPFAMGAIVTDDPERVAKIALTKRSNTKSSRKYQRPPGDAEVKHSRSSSEVIDDVMKDIHESGALLFATSQPMYSEGDNPKDSGSAIYAGTLSRMLIKISEKGPEGIYRIRIDSSDHIDKSLLEMVADASFDGSNGKTLAHRKSVEIVDSDLVPPIQVADVFVGEYRKKLNDKDSKFADKYGVIVANKKRWCGTRVSPSSLPLKAECMDSCDLSRTDVSPLHASRFGDSRVPMDTNHMKMYKKLMKRKTKTMSKRII